MAADRHDRAEQEISIRDRGSQLYEAEPPSAAGPPAREFREYLRETPAAPLSTSVKVILWALGVVVVAIFLLALWRLQKSAGPRVEARPPTSARASEPAPAANDGGGR